MMFTNTYNAYIAIGTDGRGDAAAAAAYNDPAVYPQDGRGVDTVVVSGGNPCDAKDLAKAAVMELAVRAECGNVKAVLATTGTRIFPKDMTSFEVNGVRVDVAYIDPTREWDTCSADPNQIRRGIAAEAVRKALYMIPGTDAPHPMSGRMDLIPGQYVLYRNGDRHELGRVKSVTARGAFVWYHAGETAANTPFDALVPLANASCILDTDLGGEDAAGMFRDTAGQDPDGDPGQEGQ